MTQISYVGSELELFEGAKHWKNYIQFLIKPYIKGDVLEVGSGIGGTTSVLVNQGEKSWTMLEPDSHLSLKASEKINSQQIKQVLGTLDDLPSSARFDSILYIDVLEHIEQDRNELSNASRFLNDDGMVIVLSPAHPFLFSPFDQAIGHFRRYNKRSIKALSPNHLKLDRVFYVDSIGFLASAANRFLLRQSDPTTAQIQTWDRLMIPLSRWVDPLLGYQFGKTIIAVWKKSVV
jgi:SAM-dependent methyltransferase